MKKLMAIRKLISSIAITIMLIYFFIKTKNGKLVILPFLICSVSMFSKSIFVIIDKEKYIKLFAYIFVISFFVYYFLFLIFWCYVSFIRREYLSIFFSMPFYIGGIYFVRKRLFKNK